MNPYRSIELYISGKLRSDQVDNLWIKLLKDPELFDHSETLSHLYTLLKDNNHFFANNS